MNTLGNLFKVMSFGESHGYAVGCTIEGCPAGLVIDYTTIRNQLNKRKTNQTDFGSARNEADDFEIISGVFEGKTLGSPIAILIKNQDAQSKDYEELKNVFRPSHADYTNQMKYGFRDHRGGGRSSIRITAPLVVAGEIARQLIQQYYPVSVQAYVSQIGKESIPDDATLDLSEIENNAVRCPHPETANRMLLLIDQVREKKDTLGGIITCTIQNMPVGIGEPIFGKLSAQLAHAMHSINTVKGFEIGDGFKQAALLGSESNDAFGATDGVVKTKSNHDGGIQGGISNGMPIRFSVAFKPISSIQVLQQTVDKNLNPAAIEIKGRHDVCAVPRAIPIVEAYTNIVLADLILFSHLNKIT